MGKKILKIAGRVLIVVLVTLAIGVGTLYIMLQKCCNGPSKSARSLFVTTILETGQMKFLASLVLSKEEINEIVNANNMQALEGNVDDSLIQIIPGNESQNVIETPDGETVVEEFDANGIRIEEISGRAFYAKMMIIKDPSQVCVGTTYPWGEYGKELSDIVKGAGGVAGVNGGLYVSTGNKGGRPRGIVVQDGKITFNSPEINAGIYLIGFNNKNILKIKDLNGMDKAAIEKYVADEGIRDAVAFQEESSDANNHFVSLILNGEARKLEGTGSGANPRTAIGQRADGAILLLVTDGRGASGHLGATASDLIGIMKEYGAVNAANIDGGSSSTMVYNGKYEMTSVTFYYQNSSWKLPTAFVVRPKK